MTGREEERKTEGSRDRIESRSRFKRSELLGKYTARILFG